MKAFIWFLCFFVFVMVQVFIKNTGIILGGIPTVILFSVTYWIASRLSRAWEANHSKKASDAKQEPYNLPENTEENAAQMSKQRYCKFCGGAIDIQSKQCTKCGKQYFRITRHGVIICCMSLVILLLVGVIVQQNIRYSRDIAELNSQIETMENEMDAERQAYYKTLYEKLKEIDSLKKKYSNYTG